MDPAHVMEVAQGFSDRSDGAAIKSRELIVALLSGTPEPFSRHQFEPGHITCSGLVLDPGGTEVLLVHHRRLDRWLVPGGHVEAEDLEIWDAAWREVIEETGVLLFPNSEPALAGLDVHGIPSNGREPFHQHHDLLFEFRAETTATRVSQESRAVAWCAPGEFERYGVPENVRRAYARVRERRASA
jgi:8-oxo-dGTP pyrophosphatase MutT (NUDIX family)